jgi:hypothetical protein
VIERAGGRNKASAGSLTVMIRTVLASICLFAVSPALAQAPPKPPSADVPAQTGCPPNTSTVNPASGATTGQSGKPLGEKLAESGGVLCPPSGVDPQMRAPAPDVGTMPVIPPPGTPGGDQSIQPK